MIAGAWQVKRERRMYFLRFSQTSAASAACKSIWIDTYNKKRQSEYKKSLFLQGAQSKYGHYIETLRFPSFLLLTDPLPQPSSKPLHANVSQYGKNVAQHEKKVVYGFLFSPRRQCANRTEIPFTSLCSSQKSRTPKRNNSVNRLTLQTFPEHPNRSNLSYRCYPYQFFCTMGEPLQFAHSWREKNQVHKSNH